MSSTAVDPKANREAWDNLRKKLRNLTDSFLNGFENKTERLAVGKLLLDLSRTASGSSVSYGTIVLAARFLADTTALQAEVEDKFGPYTEQSIQEALRAQFGLGDDPEEGLTPSKLM